MAILILIISVALDVSFALAQVTTDISPTAGRGNLGTTVTATGQTIQITGGTRPGGGTNLFHSFNQFNLGSGDTAQFLNTTPLLPTSNILSRVTGGNPSIILGSIDTTSYPRANLFLMNPAGIVLGPSASLNVGGSIAFTTADYLRLAGANGSDAGVFHADPTATSLLISAPVTAFGFLGTSPSSISVQGTEKSELRVQPGQSISLVGGNHGFSYTDDTSAAVPDGVTLTSRHLLAPGGQIKIVSVASPGEVLAENLGQVPNINDRSFGAFGSILISEKSIIDSTGDGAGTIHIRGGRLIIDDSKVSASNGAIVFDASSILIKNSAEIVTSTATEANSGHIILKASGNIDLDLCTTSATACVSTFASTGSSGHAGNIEFISTHGDINLSSGDVISYSEINSSGNTGSIRMNSARGGIFLANSSFVFNSNRHGGTGKLGTIQINARNLHLSDSSAIGIDNEGPHVAGHIAIALDGRLTLDGGSFINTGTFGPADSSDMIIRSPEILIDGKSSQSDTRGLYTNTLSSGNGGRLHLFTDNLQLVDGGELFSKSSIGSTREIPSGRGGVISIEGYKNPGASITINGPGSGIFTSAEGTGPAGDIDVRATSVTIQNGGKISAETTGTSSNATGGSIIITATDQVMLKNGASITASSTGPADAGNISVDAGRQLDIQDSSITTEAREASGGNIEIKAIDLIRVANGSISSSVQGGPSTAGGNITIDPKTVVLQDAKILASAQQGNGGNITITTPLFLADPRSVVDASSQFGLNGSVTIQSPTSNLSETVGQLASKTSPPQVLLQNRCVALAGGEQSTFILTGRDILPSQPGGWLSSPVAMEHWTGDKIEEHASSLMVRRVEPRESSPVMTQANGTEVLSLRRLTPSGFLVRSFADRALTGCRS